LFEYFGAYHIYIHFIFWIVLGALISNRIKYEKNEHFTILQSVPNIKTPVYLFISLFYLLFVHSIGVYIEWENTANKKV
jgi:hypothetical protein